MAIAFARVSIHTRSQGHSAVAGAAYRAGQSLFDERTGEKHSYENRCDVKHSEILLPEGSSDRYKDREALWNESERCEKRKDSQVAKDIVLALPKELELKHQVTLAQLFAKEHFVSKGLAADLAIHDHGDGNPHAHLYVTMRRLKGDAFDKYKARDLNPNFANGKGGRGFVSEQEFWGTKWRDFQNEYFERLGLKLTVDENLLYSERHTGRVRNGGASYLHKQNQLRRAAARDAVMNDPDYLLKSINSRHAVFTEKQLASIVFKATDSLEDYYSALANLKSHKNILPLGEKSGVMYYTSRHLYNLERKMIRESDNLSKRAFHKSSRTQVDLIAKDKGLTEEQTSALRDITLSKDLSVLVGRAGTGKSYMLGAANTVWKKAGYDIMGISVSGIATKGLSESSDIPSSTMASFKMKLKYGRVQLDEKAILVVDEAGMMDVNDMALLVDACKRTGAKLTLVGDPDQLQPIGPGAPFRALAERHGFSELSNIYRQKDEQDRIASRNLAKGNIERAYNHYKEKGAVQFSENQDEAMIGLINQWAAQGTKEQQLILSHQNKSVDRLNLLARSALIGQGDLTPHSQKVLVSRRSQSSDGLSMQVKVKSLDIATGERILFKKNDKALGVVNGEFANVISIKGSMLKCQFDDGRKCSFDTKQFNEFDYGYAATVHKSQGITKDHVYIFVDGKGWDKHLAYVALTRHKHTVQLYADTETFKTPKQLKKSLSRAAPNDSTLDWAVSFVKRHGLNNLNIPEIAKEQLAKFKSLALSPTKSKTMQNRGLDR